MVGSSKPERALGVTRVVLVLIALAAVGAWQWFRADSTGGGSRVEQSAPVTPPVAPAPAPEAAREVGRDLSIDEQQGGHTLSRHVGKTTQELRDRLARERGITAASTYIDRSTAERIVARTLAREEGRVAAWVARTGNRPNLALSYRGQSDEIIGRSIERRRPDPIDCTDAVVVLRWNGRDGYFVLTSYPEASR